MFNRPVAAAEFLASLESGSGAADSSELEHRLRTSERRVRLIVEQLPAAVWTTDADLRVTTSIGGGLRALNLMPDEMVGVLLGEHFRGNAKYDAVVDVHRRALAGEELSYESTWHGRDL
ncbi:MAG: putative sensory box protein, partial [Acidobacteria bacterium]|nr:putative sensory box protein [Acidobacteriota bacterium]